MCPSILSIGGRYADCHTTAPPAVRDSAWVLRFSNHIRAIEPSCNAAGSASHTRTANSFRWLDAEEVAEFWGDVVPNLSKVHRAVAICRSALLGNAVSSPFWPTTTPAFVKWSPTMEKDVLES